MKKAYNMTGFWLTACMILTYAVILTVKFILNATGSNLLSNTSFTLALGTIPIYICNIPYFVMMKKQPAKPATHISLSKKQIVIIYFICEACLIVGNLIGVVSGLIINIIFKAGSSNVTMSALGQSNLFVTFLIAVIIGPIFEELIYRKFFLDRVGGYVPAAAIIMSGLCFGFFHQNLYQFFYATALGFLFAFIYISTGKNIINTVLHMLMNFIHTFLPFVILAHIDLGALTESAGDLTKMLSVASENPDGLIEMVKNIYTPWFIVFMIYGMLVFAVGIVGLVLLILHFKLFISLIPKGFTDTKTALQQIFTRPFIIAFIAFHIILAIAEMVI